MALCLLALCVAVASAVVESDLRPSFVGHRVLRFGLANDLDGEQRLRLGAAVRALGLDLWAEHPEWADVQVPDVLLPQVAALNIPHTVMIEDLQALVDLERFSIQVSSPPRSTIYCVLYLFFLRQLAPDGPFLF